MVEKALVLIVDDSVTNIQVLVACLKDNYHLKIAKSGEQCLKILLNKPYPDLILLDIEMPGIDGYEVCQRLKADPATALVPIIFVTGTIGNDAEEYGLNLAAVDYITKPIHPRPE